MKAHFPEHFSLSEEEVDQLWQKGTFVFDTNILLNLYRLSQSTSEIVLKAFEALNGRIHLPFQVAEEFFKHREEVIAEQVNLFEQMRSYLHNVPSEFAKRFSRHPSVPLEEIVAQLKECALKLAQKITDVQNASPLNFIVDADPILPRLNSLFGDHCGEPLGKELVDEINEEVERRFKSAVPPCNKPSQSQVIENPHAGDGRVWIQILRFAKQAKTGIVFVTADRQPNWWRTPKLGTTPKPIGPHFQLIRDIRDSCGCALAFYDQEGFLSEAQKRLSIGNQDLAIEEIKQLRDDTVRKNTAAIVFQERSKRIQRALEAERRFNLLERIKSLQTKLEAPDASQFVVPDLPGFEVPDVKSPENDEGAGPS